jgi:hypothetical protein
MGLFDSVGDFFALLFSKDPAAARFRREMREIRGYLKTVKPPIYKASGHVVLPGFASSVYGLYTALQPVREVMERSCLASDQRIAAGSATSSSSGASAPAPEAPGILLLRVDARPAGEDFSMVESAVSAASEDFRVFKKALEGQAAASIESELADFDRWRMCAVSTSRGCWPASTRASNWTF